MRVFVAGGTGAIGRVLVPRLIAAGHEVVGMTRSEERAQLLRAAGAEPVVCDAFDVEGVRAAVAGARPEVVVNQLTDIPPRLDPRRYEQQMGGLKRIRTDGYANLTAAASAAGARRLVAQSISFMYAPAPGLASEDDRIWTDAPEPFGDTVRATVTGERTTLDSGLEPLVLRYGWFTGPGTAFAPGGGIAGEVARRRYPIVGGGHGVSSFIHVEDAADATVLAVASSATGVLNVVDDEPAPLREWLPDLAAALGGKRPLRAPKFVAKLAAGDFAVAMSTRQRGASNARAKEALGWVPAYPTWRGQWAK